VSFATKKRNSYFLQLINSCKSMLLFVKFDHIYHYFFFFFFSATFPEGLQYCNRDLIEAKRHFSHSDKAGKGSTNDGGKIQIGVGRVKVQSTGPRSYPPNGQKPRSNLKVIWYGTNRYYFDQVQLTKICFCAAIIYFDCNYLYSIL